MYSIEDIVLTEHVLFYYYMNKSDCNGPGVASCPEQTLMKGGGMLGREKWTQPKLSQT